MTTCGIDGLKQHKLQINFRSSGTCAHSARIGVSRSKNDIFIHCCKVILQRLHGGKIQNKFTITNTPRTVVYTIFLRVLFTCSLKFLHFWLDRNAASHQRRIPARESGWTPVIGQLSTLNMRPSPFSSAEIPPRTTCSTFWTKYFGSLRQNPLSAVLAGDSLIIGDGTGKVSPWPHKAYQTKSLYFSHSVDKSSFGVV